MIPRTTPRPRPWTRWLPRAILLVLAIATTIARAQEQPPKPPLTVLVYVDESGTVSNEQVKQIALGLEPFLDGLVTAGYDVTVWKSRFSRSATRLVRTKDVSQYLNALSAGTEAFSDFNALLDKMEGDLRVRKNDARTIVVIASDFVSEPNGKCRLQDQKLKSNTSRHIHDDVFLVLFRVAPRIKDNCRWDAYTGETVLDDIAKLFPNNEPVTLTSRLENGQVIIKNEAARGVAFTSTRVREWAMSQDKTIARTNTSPADAKAPTEPSKVPEGKGGTAGTDATVAQSPPPVLPPLQTPGAEEHTCPPNNDIVIASAKLEGDRIVVGGKSDMHAGSRIELKLHHPESDQTQGRHDTGPGCRAFTCNPTGGGNVTCTGRLYPDEIATICGGRDDPFLSANNSRWVLTCNEGGLSTEPVNIVAEKQNSGAIARFSIKSDSHRNIYNMRLSCDGSPCKSRAGALLPTTVDALGTAEVELMFDDTDRLSTDGVSLRVIGHPRGSRNDTGTAAQIHMRPKPPVQVESRPTETKSEPTTPTPTPTPTPAAACMTTLDALVAMFSGDEKLSKCASCWGLTNKIAYAGVAFALLCVTCVVVYATTILDSRTATSLTPAIHMAITLLPSALAGIPRKVLEDATKQSNRDSLVAGVGGMAGMKEVIKINEVARQSTHTIETYKKWSKRLFWITSIMALACMGIVLTCAAAVWG